MESIYYIVAICVNETSWAHVWRLHSHYLGTGYDNTFVHQAKYTKDLTKKFNMAKPKPVSTPMSMATLLGQDEDGEVLTRESIGA
jgi:hypothetical protein